MVEQKTLEVEAQIQQEQKLRLLEQLRFNSVNTGQGANVQKIVEILDNVVLPVEVIIAFNKIRELLIEQKAYSQLSFQGESLYKDVAADASLWGQITLMDLVIVYTKLP